MAESDVERLLAELRAGGRVDSRGAFTLDREKARDKMQRFQLADPRHYLLLLVQAAVLKGARRIGLAIDADDVRLDHDGDPWSVEDLEQLYNAMFARTADPAARARRELALGLNAAMAIAPRWLRLESSSGGHGVQLEMRPGRPDVFEAVPGRPDGTRLHLRERFTPGQAIEFLQDLRGTLAEEALLRARCRYASIDIVLEGQALAAGPRVEGALVTVPLEGDALTGVAGVLPADLPPRVVWVTHGVIVTEGEIRGAPPGVRVVAVAPGLSKDVSQAAFVQDERYEAAMSAVHASVRALTVALAGELASGSLGDLHPWARAWLLDQLVALSRRSLRARRPAERTRALREAELLPTVGDEGHVSLARLEAIVQAGGVAAWTTLPDPLPLAEHEIVLALSAPSERVRGLLTRTFGEAKAVNVDGEIEAVRARERKRLAWRARRAEPTLPPGRFLARRCATGAGWSGEIGLRAAPGERCSFAFVRDGCLLGTEVRELSVQGLHVAVEAHFAPTRDFDGVCPDAVLAEVLAGVAAELPALADTAARSAGRGDAAAEAARRSAPSPLRGSTSPCCAPSTRLSPHPSPGTCRRRPRPASTSAVPSVQRRCSAR